MKIVRYLCLAVVIAIAAGGLLFAIIAGNAANNLRADFELRPWTFSAMFAILMASSCVNTMLLAVIAFLRPRG
jgi:hypothetical protein